MADIGEELRTYLLTQSTVTTLVSTRIYCDQLPQNVELPACVYSIVSQIPEEAVTNVDVGVSFSRIQVDSYSNHRTTQSTSANRVDIAIRDVLKNYRGDMGSTLVTSVRVQNGLSSQTDRPVDGSETFRYITSTDYLLHHED